MDIASILQSGNAVMVVVSIVAVGGFITMLMKLHAITSVITKPIYDKLEHFKDKQTVIDGTQNEAIKAISDKLDNTLEKVERLSEGFMELTSCVKVQTEKFDMHTKASCKQHQAIENYQKMVLEALQGKK